MASANRKEIKRPLLLVFVTISILLIGAIWVDGLIVNEPATPSYYRDSFQMDPNVYLTITAQAIEFEQNLRDGTPAPDPAEERHDGSGGGQGQGHGLGDATAVPTPTISATSTP